MDRYPFETHLKTMGSYETQCCQHAIKPFIERKRVKESKFQQSNIVKTILYEKYLTNEIVEEFPNT